MANVVQSRPLPSGVALLHLQADLAKQRRAVRELFVACCDQGHPEFFGTVAFDVFIEINAIRARIDALLHPGRHWEVRWPRQVQ